MLDQADYGIAGQSILLSSLPENVAMELLVSAAPQVFNSGATIFLQGDPASSIYIVISGWVKLFRLSQNGAEAVVGVFTKGRSFGEAAAFQGDVYPVSAEAVTDCRVLHIRAGVVLEAMKSRPEICTAILAATFKHLHSLVEQIEQLKARTGVQRVAEFLADLCHCEAGSCTVTLPYDKILIAGRLGMTPESLSRAFARLRECGVSIKHNHAAIADVGRLRNYFAENRHVSWDRMR